jgi:general L-amino acid transport system substrate-binding protein
MMLRRLAVATFIAAGPMALGSPSAEAGAILDAVKSRGQVICGVNQGLPGFGAPDSQGKWSGLDVDVCKAVAAAVFGDPEKVRYTVTTTQSRFPALQSGEVDILSRNTTQTLLRDAQLGFHMAGVNFYDGQGFMVPKKINVTSAKQLNGATVCVQPGTTTELNLADYFRSNNMQFKPVVIEKIDEVTNAFFNGRCDVFTTDGSGLASTRMQMAQKPDDWVILPERISKEPLGPVVRKGDDQWYAIVRWTLDAMIEAEELGINSKNLEEKLKSTDPATQRVLGVVDAGFGKSLGLSEKWVYNIVKAVGNYGESFDRNVGKDSPLKLERGLNDLWTRGGLMYALPLR